MSDEIADANSVTILVGDNRRMHPIDRLGSLLMRVDRRRLGIFPDGWGERLSLELFERLPSIDDPIPEVDIIWGRKEEHTGLRVRRGSFASPIGDLVAPEARVVPLEMIEPAAGAARVVVLMPAWNDHGFGNRRRLARLLAERGVGSVSFDIPFYGGRRTVVEPAQPSERSPTSQ